MISDTIEMHFRDCLAIVELFALLEERERERERELAASEKKTNVGLRSAVSCGEKYVVQFCSVAK